MSDFPSVHGNHGISFAKCAAHFDEAGDDAGSAQCCSGICLSVVLSEALPVVVTASANAHEAKVAPRLFASDPVGLLRPPRHLI